MNDLYYDMKIKTNGHVVFNRPISHSKVVPEITYYF